MSRDMVIGVVNALDNDRIVMAGLVEIVLPDPIGVLRYINTPHSKMWGGFEWQGAGALLDIQPPEEDGTLEAHKGSIRLNGLDAGMLSIALRAQLNFRQVNVWAAFWDPDTNVPIGHVLFFRGTIGQVRGLPTTEAED